MNRVLVAIAALLLVCPAPAEAAARPWSGYRTDPGRTADSGFVGARLVDGQVTYRLDAKARPGKAYAAAVVQSGRAEARTAWILSKYGAVRVADQAAAVDLATYALMSGQGVDGKRARQRLRGTRRSAEIRSLARQMLVQSDQYAGPYRVELAATPAVIGGTVVARVRVLSATGAPVPRLPVVLTLGGATRQSETSPDGETSASFPADRAGVHQVTATVSKLPEWELTVRAALARKASRIAVVASKRSVTTTTWVAVRARPWVTPVGVGNVRHNETTVARFDLVGGVGTPRAAMVTAHGPFGPGETPSCTRTVWVGNLTVAADGSYSSPPVTLGWPGVYVWRVDIAGDVVNEFATGCGGLSESFVRP